jgi:hypothetical protein
METTGFPFIYVISVGNLPSEAHPIEQMKKEKKNRRISGKEQGFSNGVSEVQIILINMAVCRSFEIHKSLFLVHLFTTLFTCSDINCAPTSFPSQPVNQSPITIQPTIP